MTAFGKLIRTTAFRLTLVYLFLFALFAASLLGYFAWNTRRMINEQITTIVNAEIDPLRSDGETLAEALRQAGGKVDQRTFAGVTHEFFGMGTVVRGAYDANAYAVGRLKSALKK